MADVYDEARTVDEVWNQVIAVVAAAWPGEKPAYNNSPTELITRLINERDRLQDILNAPEVAEFLTAAEIEAKHQRVRRPDGHDASKAPEDWLWTLAYLATKALAARRYGDRNKYLHHIITAAALCANWHRSALADRFAPKEPK